MELDGSGVEVAGFGGPVLAFASVWCEFDDFARAEVIGLVDVEDGLDEVVAGGDLREVAGGEADSGLVNRDRLVGGDCISVNAEGLLGGAEREVLELVLIVGGDDVRGELEAGFCGGVSGEEDDEMAVEGFGGGGDGCFNFQVGGWVGRAGEEREKEKHV